MTSRAGRGIFAPVNASHAIYENGTFRPLYPVDLPEATEVIVTPLAPPPPEPPPALVPWEQRREAWLAELDDLRSTMRLPPPGSLTVEQILDDDRGD